jgi:hypothetical protein
MTHIIVQLLKNDESAATEPELAWFMWRWSSVGSVTMMRDDDEDDDDSEMGLKRTMTGTGYREGCCGGGVCGGAENKYYRCALCARHSDARDLSLLRC